jgi:histidine ammonia-lyase
MVNSVRPDLQQGKSINAHYIRPQVPIAALVAKKKNLLNSPAIRDLPMTSAYSKASTRRSMPRMQRCAEMIQPIRRICRRLQAAWERVLAAGGSQLPAECITLFAYTVGGREK